MSDKLLEWCEEVTTEHHLLMQKYRRSDKSATQVLAEILRNRTDFRLVEPLPEGAVPVRIYAERNINGVVETYAVDVSSDDAIARQMVTSEYGTHRSAIDTFLLPIVTPIVNAEPRGWSDED